MKITCDFCPATTHGTRDDLIDKGWAGLAILGAIYVASGRALAANILWSISNPALVLHNIYSGQNEQAAMFMVFSLVSVYGIYYMVHVRQVVWYDAGQWRLFSKKQGSGNYE